MSTLKKVKVKSLPARVLTHIEAPLWEEEVYIVPITGYVKTNAGKTLINNLNERFVREQLGLNIPESDNRDQWYSVEDQNGSIDYGGKGDRKYSIFLGAIKEYMEKIKGFYGYDYWGFAMDKLNMMSKARAMAMTLDGISFMLDVNILTKEFFKVAGEPDKLNQYFKTINEIPFFLVLCEKTQVLKSTMKGLKALGYTQGWLGIVTEGFSSTSVVRMLMEYQQVIPKFHVFVLHDLDADGLRILFDIKRYFPAESAGLNPELIERAGLNKDDFMMDYDTKNGKALPAQIKGTYSMLNGSVIRKKRSTKRTEGLEISNEDRKRYSSWVIACANGKAELNKLTGIRLNESMDLNPARDFVDYIEHLLEHFERIYDLNRLRKPDKRTVWANSVNDATPDFIENIRREIIGILEDKIDSFLDTNSYDDEDSWRIYANVIDVIESAELYRAESSERKDKQLKRKRASLKKANEDYKKSLLNIDNHFIRQNREMAHVKDVLELRVDAQINTINELIDDAVKDTEEYSEAKESLEGLKDNIEKALEAL